MDNNADDPSESDLKKIEKVLQDINNKKTPKVRKKPKKLTAKDKERLGVAIANRLSELVDSYILLGYDVNGNSLVLINSQSDLESRGISDLLEDFMSSSSNTMNISLEDDEDDEYED